MSMRTQRYIPFVNQLLMAGDCLSVRTAGLFGAFIFPGHFLKGMYYENPRKHSNGRITESGGA